jgi:hypothetical protein
MNFLNRIELRLEKFDKMHVLCDHDCQWGSVYDFAKNLASIALQKIQEQESQQQNSENNAEQKKESKQSCCG